MLRFAGDAAARRQAAEGAAGAPRRGRRSPTPSGSRSRRGAGRVELELDDYTGLARSSPRTGRSSASSSCAATTALARTRWRSCSRWTRDVRGRRLPDEGDRAARARARRRRPRASCSRRRTTIWSRTRTPTTSTPRPSSPSYAHEVPVENVPACILGRAPRKHPRTLDARDARLGRAHRHDGVHQALRGRRLLHEGAPLRDVLRRTQACRGVHVNWVRAHGFAPLDADRSDRAREEEEAEESDLAAE